MLFNSFQFLVFFPIVTTAYYALPHRYRWLLLLGASCYFYMAFVPAYILILVFTIVAGYTAGLMIEDAANKRLRKLSLAASLVVHIGVLAFFKYFNFLNNNVFALAQVMHWNYPIQGLAILLPIGLSFQTFQAMSHTIEVYRGNCKTERHLGIYALYVMFYPQLVAGPIGRPQNLLHQFHEKHAFDYDGVTDGLKLMCWGFFQKLVIADRLAPIVNQVYGDPQAYGGPALMVATVLFTFQVFCDFAGYSNIAIGAAQVMGIKLMRNFDRPYFSRSIAEFWRRWHISLSSWFRDYVYIPMGGNRVPKSRWRLNVVTVFLLSGLWHGASWTYVLWGALHGLYLIVEDLLGKLLPRGGSGTNITSRHSLLSQALQIAITFMLVCFAWIFFRASTVSDALYIVSHLFTGWQSLAHGSLGMKLPIDDVVVAGAAIAFMETIHVLQGRGSIRGMISAKPVWFRWSLYTVAVTVLIIFGKIYSSPQQFIYFQF
jgi:alginate O-acetyltransferase complex protein AlgI